MGSKRNILDFVVSSILEVRAQGDQRLYDLFGGSAIISASFRNVMPVTCNDIQSYTQVLAKTYLNNYTWTEHEGDVLSKIVEKATKRVEHFKEKYSVLDFNYSPDISYKDMVELEKKQQNLLTYTFNGLDHLFVQNYSGTYWSYDQCLWIDALSGVARSDEYKNTFLHDLMLSSLMFAMAYCTQSTGHYAQYRDVTKENQADILSYRLKKILPLFCQKFESLRQFYNGENNSTFEHRYSTSHYIDVLNAMEEGSIVYADPPYQFVHYSRFYHALETLVRYDYPNVEHKGRYREDRHQSPFCIRTKVKGAFTKLFSKVYEKDATLVLSYSDTGMIAIEDLQKIAANVFKGYSISFKEMDYKHSTMGRQKDKSRDVKESLLICTPI